MIYSFHILQFQGTLPNFVNVMVLNSSFVLQFLEFVYIYKYGFKCPSTPFQRR